MFRLAQRELKIKEGDLDFHLGGVLIRKPKEKNPKFVPFIEEDFAILKSYPTALPHLYFFQHGKGWVLFSRGQRWAGIAFEKHGILLV
jgi:hypothetical protein